MIEELTEVPRPWKHMTMIRKYTHFTLFAHKCPNGATYHVTFLNWEIAQAEGKIDVQVIHQGKRYKSNGKKKR